MKVLFVYCNRHRQLLPAPPVGLSYVASATRRAGHEVCVVDLFAAREPTKSLAAAIRRFGPEVVGISVRNIDSTVMQLREWAIGRIADEIVPAIRRTTAAPVVVGGPAVSILGEAVFSVIAADYAVIGEGEESFPALLAAMGAAAGGRPILPDGVLAAGAGAVERAPAGVARRVVTPGASGMEEWIDWLPYERRGGTWAIQTKRGCPLKCVYCAYPGLEGKRWRFREPAAVADEIERAVAVWRPRTFEFVDSTFNIPAQHAFAVCEEIIRRRLKVRLSAMGVNPAGLTPELLAAMREAGFVAMMVTPESASPAVLEGLGKGFGIEAVERAVELVRGSGIASAWFFLMGGPGETPATVEETVSFVERHLDWPGCLAVFLTGLRVLPGTRLETIARAAGLLAADRSLARPVYYLSPEVTEAEIIDRLNRAIGRRPNIVHGAEEGAPRFEGLAHRLLHLLGIAPPYWRFLPRYLHLAPVRFLRSRFPTVRVKAAAGGRGGNGRGAA